MIAFPALPSCLFTKYPWEIIIAEEMGKVDRDQQPDDILGAVNYGL
jgi:hypothetical protein